jgi:hypothetical protein
MSGPLDAVFAALSALQAEVAELRDAQARRFGGPEVSTPGGERRAQRDRPSPMDRKRAAAALRRQGFEPPKAGGRP